MMGPNGIYYLNQVMILVANSEDLQKCSPQSILISAMRAASLRLSVDPGQGQAWIIPYKNEATFQVGYKGVYELALRTNYYRFINVIDVYEGETITEDRMTGIHHLGGQRKTDNVTHRMLYFQLVNGYEKTFVMSLEEIDQHARHYSRAYSSPRSKWNDPVERPKMERKTVLVNGLRRWGRFNQDDLATLDQIESEQGWTGALPTESEITVVPEVKHTEAENMAALGFTPAPPKTTLMPRETVDASTGEINPAPEAQPEQADKHEVFDGPDPLYARWPADAKVGYDLAKTVLDSKNHRYVDMPKEKIGFVKSALLKRKSDNHLTPEDLDSVNMKLDILDILNALVEAVI